MVRVKDEDAYGVTIANDGRGEVTIVPQRHIS